MDILWHKDDRAAFAKRLVGKRRPASITPERWALITSGKVYRMPFEEFSALYKKLGSMTVLGMRARRKGTWQLETERLERKKAKEEQAARVKEFMGLFTQMDAAGQGKIIERLRARLTAAGK